MLPLYLGHIILVQTNNTCTNPLPMMLIGFCDALLLCAGVLLGKSLFRQTVPKSRVVFFTCSLILNVIVVSLFGGATSWLG